MEISPAYVDVAVERWQAETGKEAVLDGDGRTFVQVRTERLGDSVAVMDNGVVVHAGAMKELAENEELQHSLLGLAL